MRDLLPALRRHTGAGRPLRVITTTYTGSTELRALQALVEAGAEVKVSYDTASTRLHAKAWCFRSPPGASPMPSAWARSCWPAAATPARTSGRPGPG